MRLASFNADGKDRIGLALERDEFVDIAELFDATADLLAGMPVPAEMLQLIAAGEPLLAGLAAARSRALEQGLRLRRFHGAAVCWQPPVRTPTKIVCLALNNRALDAIKIRAPTDHPAFFLKPSTALTGHLQPIHLRPAYGLTHPEPELAVVIGRRLKDISATDAMAGVFGYTIMNDVTSVGMREEDSFSVRYFKPGPRLGEVSVGEAHTTYPGRYKASDTFAPMGPWLVTRDEVPDPADLRISCTLGDRLVAADHSRNYVWGVAEALAHITRTMTLLPGDIVSMGTAVGGERDMDAPDVPGVTRANLTDLDGMVSVTIDRIGTLSNPVRML